MINIHIIASTHALPRVYGQWQWVEMCYLETSPNPWQRDRFRMLPKTCRRSLPSCSSPVQREVGPVWCTPCRGRGTYQWCWSVSEPIWTGPQHLCTCPVCSGARAGLVSNSSPQSICVLCNNIYNRGRSEDWDMRVCVSSSQPMMMMCMYMYSVRMSIALR